MIYIVTGFMRSGTSMMCECLEAGGMSVVKSESRDRFGAAHSDERYAVNPNGLYEPNPGDMQTDGWPRMHDGKAIKVVFPLISSLAVHAYKVVAMLREPEEIRQSYEAAFGQRIPLERIKRTNVRAWRLVKSPSQIPERDWGGRGYLASWTDGKLNRHVVAADYRETWTQYDPELAEREILPKERRRPLRGE